MTPPRTEPFVDPSSDARAQLLAHLASGELELPIMPATAAQVLEACRDENAGARRVAETVGHDPALAAHVLRVANSAAFAPPEPVVSLPQAVNRMGLRTVSQIALAVCVKGRVFRADSYTHLLEDVWPQSALAAGWAREIARLRHEDIDNAFLVGLLHDVGRPVVLQALVEIERKVRRPFGETQAKAAMDFLHPRIGAELMRNWNMPDWMSDAIAWHHEPSAAIGHREEAYLASLSENLARWTLDAQGEADPALLESEAPEVLSLHPNQFEHLLAQREAVRLGADGLQ